MGPIFDNTGKQIAEWVGDEVISLDGKKRYSVDFNGNLRNKVTGELVGHLIPGGANLPDGRPSPSQTIF